MIQVHDTEAGATFAVKVHPRAKKNAITGEANDACIEFFTKLLKVSRSSVTIAAGQTSRNKVIRVAGISAEEVRSRLII